MGFASRSAGLRRENIQYADQLMGKIDRVQMMRQELDIQRRQAAENAAANLFNKGAENLEYGMNKMYDDASKIIGKQLGEKA